VAVSDRAELGSRITELIQAGETEELLSLISTLTAERDGLTAERDGLAKRCDQLAVESDGLAARLEHYKIEVARLRRLVHGRRSEKLSLEELGQLVLALGGTEEEAAAMEPKLPLPTVSDEGSEEEAPSKPNKGRPNHRGRSKLSKELERVIDEVKVPEAERACQQCGKEMSVFTHVDHERVEYVPAKLVVHVDRCEKLGCKACGGDAVTATRQDADKRPLRAGPSLLAHLIESKCDDALPIHRQCDQLSRLGFELPPSTAYGYFRYATELLLPVAEAHLGSVLEDPDWVGVDDTRLDVLDKHHPSGKYRGHLWCFRARSGLIAYEFTKSWRAEEIAPWFHAIGEQTHVQVDDYKGYSKRFMNDGQLVQVVPDERRLGCMMHVRRRFYAAFKTKGQPGPSSG